MRNSILRWAQDVGLYRRLPARQIINEGRNENQGEENYNCYAVEAPIDVGHGVFLLNRVLILLPCGDAPFRHLV